MLEWLKELRRRNAQVYGKCVAAIQRLAELGHELRRPLAHYLQDGIYELRVRRGHVNYRILYFLRGRTTAVLAHALTKEEVVPVADTERALRRKTLYESAPNRHAFEGNLENAQD